MWSGIMSRSRDHMLILAWTLLESLDLGIPKFWQTDFPLLSIPWQSHFKVLTNIYVVSATWHNWRRPIRWILKVTDEFLPSWNFLNGERGQQSIHNYNFSGSTLRAVMCLFSKIMSMVSLLSKYFWKKWCIQLIGFTPPSTDWGTVLWLCPLAFSSLESIPYNGLCWNFWL